MCKELLLKLIRRVSKRVSGKPRINKELETRIVEEMKKGKSVRLIRTSRGGPNMPKYQPCPVCHARAKRKFKTELGANYACRCGRAFFVGR